MKIKKVRATCSNQRQLMSEMRWSHHDGRPPRRHAPAGMEKFSRYGFAEQKHTDAWTMLLMLSTMYLQARWTKQPNYERDGYDARRLSFPWKEASMPRMMQTIVMQEIGALQTQDGT